MKDVKFLRRLQDVYSKKGRMVIAYYRSRKNRILPFRGPECSFTYKQTNTHQMEREGHHQEKYPQIKVTRVVEFVLVRVMVPAAGKRCPYTLTQGLHNLRTHLSSGLFLLLSAQIGRPDDAAAARLQ